MSKSSDFEKTPVLAKKTRFLPIWNTLEYFLTDRLEPLDRPEAPYYEEKCAPPGLTLTGTAKLIANGNCSPPGNCTQVPGLMCP